MAVRKKPKLTPMAELSPEEQALRRFARKEMGMKDEQQLNRFIERMRKLPESDPRHLRADIPDDRRDRILMRIRQKDKKTLTPWREIERKKRMLVDELGKMSNFTFNEKYKSQIEAALTDDKTSDYGKKRLRQLRAELHKRSAVPTQMMPDKNGQGRLF